MLEWLRGKTEKRSADPSELVEALLGSGAALPGLAAGTAGLAAVEAVARLYARSLEAAVVEPVEAARVLKPELLSIAGRAMLLRGELGALLSVRDGRLVADPASVTTPFGGSPDPMSWSYQLSLPRPSAKPGENTSSR